MAFVKLTEGFNEDNFITGYVPGGEPMNLDDGVAFLIPKGSVLGLQIHFVATGKPEKCKVSVGLRYPREVVQQAAAQHPAHRHALRHPARRTGAQGRREPGARPRRHRRRAVLAHAPARQGHDVHGPPARRDKTETLLIIPNYNFSWQIPYRWEPGKKLLPKGTRLECVAHFDNSPFNPYNPDPKATVRNGPQTHHEMMYGFFFYTHAKEELAIPVDPKDGTVRKPAGGKP